MAYGLPGYHVPVAMHADAWLGCKGLGLKVGVRIRVKVGIGARVRVRVRARVRVRMPAPEVPSPTIRCSKPGTASAAPPAGHHRDRG